MVQFEAGVREKWWEVGKARASPWSWKRDNLTEDINGSLGEGTITELVTSAGSGKTFEIGNILLRIVPQ